MLTVLNHSLIKHKISIMRDKTTSTYIFKQNLDEIAKLMAYEVTKDIPVREKIIETPICETTGYEVDIPLVLVPILRAGIGLVDGFRDIIPTAKVGHIGMYRNEETLEPVVYYFRFPKCLPQSMAIITDPMLATGGSADAAITHIKTIGAKKILLVCLVGVPEGVERIQKNHPDVDITLAVMDDHLNENGYIVPGLGDAGDRLFGTD